MKTVGVIGAMDLEIALLKPKIEIISVKNVIGTDFYMGKMLGKSVVLVRCGIGKVNAAICTQVLIDMYGVDYIINTGVAGSLSSQLSIGDVVVSEDLVHHDFDTSFTGDPVGCIPRMGESFFKANLELVRLAMESSELVLSNNKAVLGRIATGDQFISDNDTKKRIVSNFKALCTEMEGAAIAHAAYLNKIPFVVIRAISDNSDEDANMSFEKFAQIAAKNSSDIVEHMIQSI